MLFFMVYIDLLHGGFLKRAMISSGLNSIERRNVTSFSWSVLPGIVLKIARVDECSFLVTCRFSPYASLSVIFIIQLLDTNTPLYIIIN